MQGNAAEWCQDVYAPYPNADGRASAVEREPVALEVEDSDLRVLRGGAFRDAAEQVRCAARDKTLPTARRDTIGFRVARSYP